MKRSRTKGFNKNIFLFQEGKKKKFPKMVRWQKNRWASTAQPEKSHADTLAALR